MYLQPAEWVNVNISYVHVYHDTWTRLNVLAINVGNDMIETVTIEKVEEEEEEEERRGKKRSEEEG